MNLSYPIVILLCSYVFSEKTFMLYASFIIGLMKAGRKLAVETMSNTVKMYGYANLQEAEEKVD